MRLDGLTLCRHSYAGPLDMVRKYNDRMGRKAMPAGDRKTLGAPINRRNPRCTTPSRLIRLRLAGLHLPKRWSDRTRLAAWL